MIRSRAGQTPGVDLLLGHQVTGLVREAGRAVGVRASAPGGEREIRAPLVVGADGKDSAVAKFAGMPARRYENARFGYLAHFRGLPLPGGIGQAWFLEPDMAYAFPNDDGVTVLAVLPDKKRLPAFRKDLEGSFSALVRALPEAPPIDSAERITKIIGTVDHPLHSRRPIAPGIALIGDAALTGDPLWGVGCGWALQSARWLAEAVAPAATGRGGLDGALAAYARTHRRRLRGHQYLAADFAKGRPFNPLERLMFSAAARCVDGTAHAPVRVPPDRSDAVPEPPGAGQGHGRQHQTPRGEYGGGRWRGRRLKGGGPARVAAASGPAP